MEVAAVDEDHLERGAAELQRRLQAAEAAADDDNAMRTVVHALKLATDRQART